MVYLNLHTRNQVRKQALLSKLGSLDQKLKTIFITNYQLKVKIGVMDAEKINTTEDEQNIKLTPKNI